MQIPSNQSLVTDYDVFSAFDLSLPELSTVRSALESENIALAKQELIHYFETRKNTVYYYDCRKIPLMSIDTDSTPYVFQAALGLKGSLKDFCLYAGRKLMEHIYVRPGGELELFLGDSYENMPHFNFYEDQGKKSRSVLDIFVRGQIFEYLSVLYHETGDCEVLEEFRCLYQAFFRTYPLLVEAECISEGRFSMTEERDIMSTGFLAISMLSLLYTRLPYEIPSEEAFDIIKNLWYLGIQFRRFDHSPYQDYNHHLWEKGLVPYILSIMLPEIPDFSKMREHSISIINRHIKQDFNSHGGYNEHSISYWGGAALGEMLCRGISLAQRNKQQLLDSESSKRINCTFSALAAIAPPGKTYPSVGDGGKLLVNPILENGILSVNNDECRQVLEMRTEAADDGKCRVSLDYCDDSCGFACSRSSFSSDGNYFLMSVKNSCSSSGHNHMDMLSLNLSFHGEDFIGEPYAHSIYHTVRMGTAVRGYLYNMGAHNTVLAYGQPVVPDVSFSDKWGVYRPDSPVDVFLTAEDGVYLEAHHDAYCFCRHKRKLLFHREKGILLEDEIMRGNRMPGAHIQRWHFMPEVSCIQIDDNSIMLQKGTVKVMCIWPGLPQFRFWRNSSLYPENIKSEAELGMILDVSFSGYGQVNGDLASVSQAVLMVDVSECVPEKNVCNALLTYSSFPKTEQELVQILKKFDELSSAL